MTKREYEWMDWSIILIDLEQRQNGCHRSKETIPSVSLFVWGEGWKVWIVQKATGKMMVQVSPSFLLNAAREFATRRQIHTGVTRAVKQWLRISYVNRGVTGMIILYLKDLCLLRTSIEFIDFAKTISSRKRSNINKYQQTRWQYVRDFKWCQICCWWL